MKTEAKSMWVFSCLAFLCMSSVMFGQKASDAPTKILVGPNLRASDNVRKGGRNECWIAASQISPSFLVGVSQSTKGPNSDEFEVDAPRLCTTLISRNGGQTWREISLPKQEAGCFDTMAVSSPDGRVYVSQPMIGRNFGLGMENAALLSKSTIRIYSTLDEGKSWKGPGELSCPLPPDHPRMVVDDSNGPHRGRLYVEWNEVDDSTLKNQFHLFLQYSDDGGMTFNDAILVTTAVSEGGKLVATEPVVLSDGTLLATYYQYWNPLSDPKNESQPLYIVRSTDGAKTLSDPIQIAQVGTSAPGYLRRDFSRAFTLPIVAADTSATSSFRDRIYIVWQDMKDGWADIWLVKSADKGVTWSKPIRLNDNSPSIKGGPLDYRVTPVVNVNRDGVVGVAWYDYRDDPKHICWREYFTASINGGETFLPNVAVSSQPSCPAKEDLRPSVYVWNTSPYLEDSLPSKDELKQIPDLERYRLQQEVSIAEALRKEEEKGDQARIDVTFNDDRNLWPGHYTGLTSNSNGVFHVLWSDRRNAPLQQLYTASVEVLLKPEPPRPATQETAVTKLVRLVGGPATFDSANKTTTFELQIRNVSNQVIYGPLHVRITSIGSTAAGPTAAIMNPDPGGPKGVPSWDFSNLLGARQLLDPGMISEAKKLTIRTNDATGLDGVLNFEVIGQLAQGSQPTSGATGQN